MESSKRPWPNAGGMVVLGHRGAAFGAVLPLQSNGSVPAGRVVAVWNATTRTVSHAASPVAQPRFEMNVNLPTAQLQLHSMSGANETFWLGRSLSPPRPPRNARLAYTLGRLGPHGSLKTADEGRPTRKEGLCRVYTYLGVRSSLVLPAL